MTLAQWHSDLRFSGSPVLKNAVIPAKNFQDIMVAHDGIADIEAYVAEQAEMQRRLNINLVEQPPNAQQLGQMTRRLLPFYNAYIAPILQITANQFTPEMMNLFRITCLHLDFQSGDVPEGYVKLFHPMRKELLNLWIVADKTGNHVDAYRVRIGIDLLSVPLNNYDQAMSVWTRGVAAYLTPRNHNRNLHPENNHLPQPQWNFTPWRVTNNRYTQIRRRVGNGTNWSAEGLFHYCAYNSDVRDETKPHAIAFVADQTPFVESVAPTSAVQTGIWLAGAAVGQDFMRNHNIYPVMVLCCSGHKVRVVQVVVNFLRRSVEIRLSEIVDLRLGWEHYLRFLTWFLPDPIGYTTAL
ncbi:unnamed protein product [Clonostachys rosea]|uniref:Uncharacterized protein n=1 Tax=Bionectria ochroleuca TaxID=29856 RepID=A0ABY6UPI9_BIOOC|nr:unnamed protein product [Clonostachys rosea]